MNGGSARLGVAVVVGFVAGFAVGRAGPAREEPAAAPATREKSASRFPADPLDATFSYSDIRRFWEAFDDLAAGDSTGNPFEEYLSNGTAGVADFVPGGRIVSAEELLSLVQAERDYYTAVRPSTLRVARYEDQIRAAYYALEYWYPPAVFPPVYFVIGRTTSGGTASENGTIIGTEVFSSEPLRTTYGRPTIPLDHLPFTVAHEIIHFLQRQESPSPTLLEMAIREGSADFLGELIAGEAVKTLNGPDLYPYGDTHAREFWEEFRGRLDDTDLSGWLYGSADGDRPQNLGYWMGYRIVEAFFARQEDKHRAVADILQVEDYHTFLERSAYGSEDP